MGVVSVRGEHFPAVVLMGMVGVLLSKLYFGDHSKVNALKLEVPNSQVQIGAFRISNIEGTDTNVREGWRFLGCRALTAASFPRSLARWSPNLEFGWRIGKGEGNGKVPSWAWQKR